MEQEQRRHRRPQLYYVACGWVGEGGRRTRVRTGARTHADEIGIHTARSELVAMVAPIAPGPRLRPTARIGARNPIARPISWHFGVPRGGGPSTLSSTGDRSMGVMRDHHAFSCSFLEGEGRRTGWREREEGRPPRTRIRFNKILIPRGCGSRIGCALARKYRICVRVWRLG